MEVYEAVHTVLAVREFQSKPVPDSVVHRIIESARVTPFCKKVLARISI